jgi:hypothetical protein
MAGNIQRRTDGKWRARYRDANHRGHARHFPRKRDAERWPASQEAAIVCGDGSTRPSQDHGRRMVTAVADLPARQVQLNLAYAGLRWVSWWH